VEAYDRDGKVARAWARRVTIRCLKTRPMPTGLILLAAPLDIDLVVWREGGLRRKAGGTGRARRAAASRDGGRRAAVGAERRLHRHAAIRELNAGWRGKDKPTNVLSFPAVPETREGPLPPMLGDIVLAAGTVAREAALEGKPVENHITHLVVHGLLHLLGYDHETDMQAEEMEAVERAALARLAIPDPYA